jgi:hypothetical protein
MSSGIQKKRRWVAKKQWDIMVMLPAQFCMRPYIPPYPVLFSQKSIMKTKDRSVFLHTDMSLTDEMSSLKSRYPCFLSPFFQHKRYPARQ